MVLSSLLAPGSKKAVHRDPALIPGQQEPQGYRDRCRAWMGNLCCAFQQGPNGNSESITHNAPPKQQRAGVLPLTPRNAHQQVNARAPLRWGKGRAIAEGGFGKVYAGLNLDTGELLAIKQVLVPEVMAKKDVERIKEIEDEIAVLSKLQHPNIVRYFGTERSKESLNILLEYAGGGSVTSLLQKYGPFPERVIQVYTKQIVLGLEYLHKNDIAHRDVKGANVLVTDSGGVKLADFGASKQRAADVDSLGTAYRSLKGTPCFMAPEVIQQQGYGNGADIWSIGCTVIEMATGSPPWSEKRDSHTIMFNIVTSSGPPSLPKQLSSCGRDFLRRCFERNPAKRATSSELLRHPFLKDVRIGSLRHEYQVQGCTTSPFRRMGAAGQDHRPGSTGSCLDFPCPSQAPLLKPQSTSNGRYSAISEPKFHNLLAELRDVLNKRRISIRSGEQDISTRTGDDGGPSSVAYKHSSSASHHGSKSRDSDFGSKYRCGALTPNSPAPGSPLARSSKVESRGEGSTRTLIRSSTAPVNGMRNRALEAGMAPVIKELAAKFVNQS